MLSSCRSSWKLTTKVGVPHSTDKGRDEVVYWVDDLQAHYRCSSTVAAGFEKVVQSEVYKYAFIPWLSVYEAVGKELG